MASSILHHGSWSVPEDKKILELAKLLSGYSDTQWNKLRENRKKTYVHAASQLFYGWKDFEVWMQKNGGSAEDEPKACVQI